VVKVWLVVIPISDVNYHGRRQSRLDDTDAAQFERDEKFMFMPGQITQSMETYSCRIRYLNVNSYSPYLHHPQSVSVLLIPFCNLLMLLVNHVRFSK